MKACFKIVFAVAGLIGLLFLASQVHAISGNYYTAGGKRAAADDYSDITFFWRCESADFSATNGTLDFSRGDDVGTPNNTVTISTDAVKLGTYGLDSPGQYRYYIFDANVPLIIPDDSEYRIGAWVYITSWADNSKLFNVDNGIGDYVTISFQASDEIYIDHYGGGGVTYRNGQSSTSPITTGAWHYVEAAWLQSKSKLYVWVNGVLVVDDNSVLVDWAASPNRIRIGNTGSGAADMYVDSVVISTDVNRNLYAMRNIETYPADDYTDIKFWWRAEAADFSATNGTLDFSASDTSGNIQDDITLDDSAKRFGNYGLLIPTGDDTTADFISFTTDANKIWSYTGFNVGLWAKINSWTDNGRIWIARYDGSNYGGLQLIGADEFGLFMVTDGTDDNEGTIGADISTGQWYFIEAAAEPSGIYRIKVDGTAYLDTTASYDNFTSDVTSFRIGDYSSYDIGLYLDNVIVSNLPERNLYALRNLTQYPGDDYSDITFWWRCEAADFSATNGTLDYSAGDDTASATGSPAINTDAVLYGTNGLDIPANETASYYNLSVSSIDIVNDAEGRIGFWYRWTGTYDDGECIMYFIDGANSEYAGLFTQTSYRLYFRWADSGGAKDYNTTGTIPLTDTWYFVEYAWKPAENYREVFINGESAGADSTGISEFTANPSLIRIGNVWAGAGDTHDASMDNIIISNKSTRDLYKLAFKRKYPW